jgi:hypothetical protein
MGLGESVLRSLEVAGVFDRTIAIVQQVVRVWQRAVQFQRSLRLTGDAVVYLGTFDCRTSTGLFAKYRAS